MSEPITSHAEPMFAEIIARAKAKAETLGKTITIILAPSPAVFSLINDTLRASVGLPPSKPGEHYAVMIYAGIYIVGCNLPKSDPRSQFIGAWTNEDCTIQPGCPLLDGPQPSETEMPLESAMWGIRMDEWLAEMQSDIHHCLACEPLLKASILP